MSQLADVLAKLLREQIQKGDPFHLLATTCASTTNNAHGRINAFFLDTCFHPDTYFHDTCHADYQQIQLFAFK